jgi:hypothetical protein
MLAGMLLLGLLAACASTTETKWEGKKIDEAIAEYGPPTRTSPSADGTTYVWEQRHELQGFSGVPGGTREMRVTIRMMTVNPSGIITSYSRVDQ